MDEPAHALIDESDDVIIVTLRRPESSYADRRKDLVVRDEMNVASAEVESVLMTYPGVADVPVIGVEHDVLGEDLLAVLVAPDGIDTDEQFAYARTRLADDKTPRRAVVVDELPRNSMGKVLKRELRDQLGNG